MPTGACAGPSRTSTRTSSAQQPRPRRPQIPAPVSLGPGPARVELGRDVRTVLWATGYKRSYPWLEVPVLDATGELLHREGVTPAPGLFALGLRFQRTRKSHFLGGVGDDAARIAEHIVADAGAARLRRAA